MTRHPRLWRTVAVLFVAVNALGIVLAARELELSHAALHVVLGMLGMWWVARAWPAVPPVAAIEPPPLAPHLDYLEQSLGAIAVEIDRIGEAQRVAERPEAREPARRAD